MSRHSSRASFLLALFAASAAAAGLAPPAPESSEPAASSAGWRAADLMVEPKHGQTAQQLWNDRYACHEWAKNQSGFDPSRPAGAIPGAENASRRLRYRSAMVACLESKGYSVRDVAPPSAPRPYLEREFAPVSEFEYHPLTAQIEGGYSVTQEQAGAALHNGWNAGLGLTWWPNSALPLAFRAHVSYSRFRERDQSVRLASQMTGANVAFGHESVYGGDVDAQINLRMGPSVREYFFGGVGWYRERTIFKQESLESGLRCMDFCFPGQIPVVSTVERSTTGWLHSWNAGMGFEFALAPPASFFIEARYLRIGPASSRMTFVPIRVGLRF